VIAYLARKGGHVLPHRRVRQDPADEVECGIGHSAPGAGRADASPLAGKCDQVLGRAR
jgi:hypothetical protein